MRWTIGRKMTVAFGLAVILLPVVGLVSTFTTRTLQETRELVKRTYEAVVMLDAVHIDILDAESGAKEWLLTGSPVSERIFRDAISGIWTRIDRIGALLVDNPLQQSRVATLREAVEYRTQVLEQAIDAYKLYGGTQGSVILLDRTSRESLTDIRRTIDAIRGEEEDLLVKRDREAANADERSFYAIIFITLFGLICVAVTGILTGRSITVSLAALAKGTGIVEAGNLAHRVKVFAKDEIGDLALAFNRMTARLERDHRETEKSGSLFKALFDASPDAAILVDRKGAIRLANPQASKLFGYDRARLEGMQVESLLPERFRQIHVDHRAGFMNNPQSRPMGSGLDLYGVRPDGGEFSVDVTLGSLELSGELHALAIVRDITDRKLAEKAIRHAYSEIADLYNNAPCGYHSLDAKGFFLSINDTELKWLGYTREEIVGTKHFTDLLTPAGKRKFDHMYPEFMRRGFIYDLEFDVRKADGSLLPVVVNATALTTETGEFVASRSSLFDITELRKAREELKEANTDLEAKIAKRTTELEATLRRLELNNKELQDFAYVASHDLQEPLRKIQAFGGRLRDRASAHLDETNRDYLDRMYNAAERMQTLIDDLLTFSRVTTDAKPFTACNLYGIAEGVLSDLELSVEKTGGTVDISGLSNLPEIDADETQMRQVLQNLISNALKFHNPDQKPEVRVWGECDGKRFRIFVQDNGIGFDEKYLDKIFSPFQRLHGRDTFEGTGIGLAVVRKIAHRHGGTADASSGPGKGSVFRVDLPCGYIQSKKDGEDETSN